MIANGTKHRCWSEEWSHQSANEEDPRLAEWTSAIKRWVDENIEGSGAEFVEAAVEDIKKQLINIPLIINHVENDVSFKKRFEVFVKTSLSLM